MKLVPKIARFVLTCVLVEGGCMFEIILHSGKYHSSLKQWLVL
jgi:hypothetical protein